ncbi:MAG: integration host factor subunit alpha [Hyphomicrobiales bacterium]|nr:MAG: integration host factor subunit alpha [Hyphomicrobiales bacterium]
MTSKTLTRADLAEVIYQKVGLSRSESAGLVEFIIEEILSSLEKGEEVKISSFGNFMVRDKRARIGRNPKTGEEVTITPRRVLSFRPSQVMKQRVDAG